MRPRSKGWCYLARKMAELAASQLAALSRLFSSSVVREMARKGRSPLFARLARESLLLNSLGKGECVRRVFDEAFLLLQQVGCRDEYVYKAALTRKVLLGKHSLHTASMLNEFRVEDCKADLAILNGTATVYEVKSERDSLSRLERQILAYAKVFAQVYVIAGENHVGTVLSLAPADIGVMRLNRRYQISVLREAVDRPDRTSPAVIFDSIRTSEAEAILVSRGIAVPDVSNTKLSNVLRQLFLKLEPAEAHAGMVKC